MPDWPLVQKFYNELKQPVKIFVDAIARGAPMKKSTNAAEVFLEEMTSNNYH